MKKKWGNVKTEAPQEQKCGVSLRKNEREGVKESVCKNLSEKEPSVPILYIVWSGTHAHAKGINTHANTHKMLRYASWSIVSRLQPTQDFSCEQFSVFWTIEITSIHKYPCGRLTSHLHTSESNFRRNLVRL